MTHVRDMGLSPEKLQHRAQAVQAMVLDSTGWPYLQAELEERRAALAAKILAGKLDHDEYLRLTGELAGVEFAMSSPDRLIVRSTPETEEQ